ncbi:serine/threonine-protein kinase [Amycolatopsis rubida]|uniref:Protein kinase domain-containing protein n=1 Tax=Amycolatopsis rubida TaxID=112413 RepID=A0A1I5W7Y2_9PSEU|nr:serine/threonine-protein kinase [Amycolatopsis rubida]SFQ15860.1 hypothetical protein SAMN05421854_109103 [Amycolatopsis rubida]
MTLPSMDAYQQAVQLKQSFTDPVLSRGKLERTPLMTPVVASGGFALTYLFAVDGQKVAVRCFHKQGNHLEERYNQVSRFVRVHSELPFLIPVDYLPHGIEVEGARYPVVKMPWVDGFQLDHWVEDHLREPAALTTVGREVSKAATQLRAAGAAHGDLQHGNILIDDDNAVRLIDYDGMYLPELRRYGAAEQGHRNYQHPSRQDSYNVGLDEFAAATIELSLDALAHDPSLWDRFHNEDNLLFTARDFAEPDTSNLFFALSTIPPVAEAVTRLRRACLAPMPEITLALSGGTATEDHDRVVQAAPNELVCIEADDRKKLFQHIGDKVTVFGQIESIKRNRAMRGGTITLLNTGDYRKAAFVFISYDEARSHLEDRFGPNLEGLDGSWVSVTGLLATYPTRWCDDHTPQVEISRGSELRTVSGEELIALRARSRGEEPPAPSKSPVKRVRAFPPIDFQARLKELYADSPAVQSPRPAPARPAAAPNTPATHPSGSPRPSVPPPTSYPPSVASHPPRTQSPPANTWAPPPAPVRQPAPPPGNPWAPPRVPVRPSWGVRLRRWFQGR